MKQLFIMDLKNYDPTFKRSKRPSVRAIIYENGKLAMVHSKAQHYFKFPGGGLEEFEDHPKALIREVKEELGLCIIPDTIAEFGEVVILQRSHIHKNTIFEQESYYYFCRVEDRIEAQRLDAYELDAGFTLEHVSIEEAIQVNLHEHHYDADPVMIERETRVLGLIKSILNAAD